MQYICLAGTPREQRLSYCYASCACFFTSSGNMAVVSVTNIRVLNNPCPLTDPFLFEIHFEAQQPLQQDVEWRVVYVGSGEHHSAAVQHRTSSSSNGGSSEQGEGGSSASTGNKRSSNGAGDYVLDSVLLGPIECGALAFEFAVDAPDFTKVRSYCNVRVAKR